MAPISIDDRGRPNDVQADEILELFDFYRTAPPDLRREVLEQSHRVSLPRGAFYFQEGSGCSNVAFVGSGDIRVFKVSTAGREITLYHVGTGETCLLTLNAALSRNAYPASAVAEAAVEAVLVPVESFRAWMDRHAELRQFVFGEMAHRISELMALIHEVVFRRLDRRVATYLLQAFAGPEARQRLEVTHGAIAAELGSAREVISRVLKELEREGAVELRRGHIELVDTALLRRLAGPG